MIEREDYFPNTIFLNKSLIFIFWLSKFSLFGSYTHLKLDMRHNYMSYMLYNYCIIYIFFYFFIVDMYIFDRFSLTISVEMRGFKNDLARK